MISNDSRITSLQQPKVSSDGNDLLLELLIARHLLPLLLQIICTNLNDGSKYFNLFLQDLETEIPIQNVIQAGVYERREGMFELCRYIYSILHYTYVLYKYVQCPVKTRDDARN